MFRVIVYLLLTVFLITIVRGVIGIITKGIADALRGTSQTPQNGRSTPVRPVPVTGELKRDPVCGTYTAAASSVQQTRGGETFYFCSPECRDKFIASKPATV